MTRKVLILGSSHVAALKSATGKVLVRYPDVQLDFFAAPGPLYREFQLDSQERFIGLLEDSDVKEDEIALMNRLNGASKLFYGDYDAVVLAGYSINETLNARILSRFSVDDTSHSKPGARLSKSAYLSMLAEIAQNVLPDAGWWNLETPRVFLSPAPRIAENCIHVGTRTVASWVPLVEKDLTTPDIFEIYVRFLEEIFRKIGVTFIPQPEDSFGKTGLTQSRYSEGAVYIRPGDHRADYDAKHMNAAFGEMSLERILRVVTSDPRIFRSVAPKDTTAF